MSHYNAVRIRSLDDGTTVALHAVKVLRCVLETGIAELEARLVEADKVWAEIKSYYGEMMKAE